MHPSTEANRLPIDTPATYRLCIQGQIPANWIDRLDGMTVTRDPSVPSSITILVGILSDQSALEGVLRSLFELHLLVLSMERLVDGAIDTNRLRWNS